MSFRLHRALAVSWKEALDLRKNPWLLASMLALPAVLVLVPTGVIWSWLRNPGSQRASIAGHASGHQPHSCRLRAGPAAVHCGRNSGMGV